MREHKRITVFDDSDTLSFCARCDAIFDGTGRFFEIQQKDYPKDVANAKIEDCDEVILKKVLNE